MKISLYDYCIQNDKQTLLNEWNQEKNMGLTPRGVSFRSGRKVWWVCEKGREWEVAVRVRSRGRGCPYCAGKRKVKEEKMDVQD